MDIVPMYLKELAHNCEQKKNTITFLLKCACGNEAFEVKKARPTTAKKWKNIGKLLEKV